MKSTMRGPQSGERSPVMARVAPIFTEAGRSPATAAGAPAAPIPRARDRSAATAVAFLMLSSCVAPARGPGPGLGVAPAPSAWRLTPHAPATGCEVMEGSEEKSIAAQALPLPEFAQQVRPALGVVRPGEDPVPLHDGLAIRGPV